LLYNMVRLFDRIHAHIHTQHIHTLMHACIHRHIHTYTHTRTHTHIYIHTHTNTNALKHMYTQTPEHTNRNTHTHTHTLCTHTHTHKHVQAHTHSHIHTQPHNHPFYTHSTHTHVYTYTHMRTAQTCTDDRSGGIKGPLLYAALAILLYMIALATWSGGCISLSFRRALSSLACAQSSVCNSGVTVVLQWCYSGVVVVL
jgi:hypothetical protein